MRVDSIKETSLNFKGKEKMLLKGLEKISDHGASFAAGVSFVSAMCLRPLSIALTPKTEKENKKYASANSFASGLTKLAIAEMVAIPVENGIKKISENPSKFLKKETIKTLKNGAETLVESKDYKFAAQAIKMGTGLLTAIPKSVITVALIPVFMDKFLNGRKEQKEKELKNQYDEVFSPVYNKLSFKGGISEKAAKGMGKILDIKNVQKFVQKHSKNEENIARNVMVATDILLTSTTALQISKSKKIKEDKKKPLIYNNLISTGASIIGGVSVDKLIQKTGAKTLEKFKEAHKGDPKLSKYIEGINILRPTLIFAFIYYGVLPFVSTFFADKLDKKFNSNHQQEQQ